ncbi:O-Antigen ligase [Rubripirellula obstinata]|uniref:O-Antigen ligase n=1 Tax=Rubripirellula obstinata TaxID=406547 RepID=A0A5B1CQ91_9BACT|nr:O-antigen ligase family protein [Rubripirellula obstinata]KAA1262401.1 O-Antigen ligase [Rubripirellula obstinata]
MTKQRIASSLVYVGQALIILGVVCSAWHLGGVTTTSLHAMSIGSLVVLVIAAAVMLLRQKRDPICFVIPAIACLFCGYAILHGMLGFGNHSNQIGAETVKAIDAAMVGLGAAPETIMSDFDSSLLGHRTQTALVPLASGIAFLIGASVFFVDRRSRVVFAVAVLANAVALVCWGFIQRAGSNEFILPGMLHKFDTVPFASFIYKNAGAAALIPAIAIAAVALLKGRTFQWSTSSGVSQVERSSYGSASKFFEVGNLILISAALFLSAGLVISLCRGAWLSVVVALVIAFVVDRRLKLTKANLSTAALGGLVVITLLSILGGNEIARARAGDVSLDRIASDQRWSHWPDGWDTAIANFPVGSGLGTYRYATLPHQRTVHKSWFQNAHNQYLETFTESGVIGLVLLLVAIAWLARHCFGLIREGADSSSRRWGLIGLIVLASGCIQSAIDFVLIIPANLYLYAAIFGVAIACSKRPIDSSEPRSPWWGWNPDWKLPAATVLASTVIVIASISFSSDQRHAERVLTKTSVGNLSSQPTDERIDQAMGHLTQAIERLPNSPDLHARRAAWEIIRMRTAILQLAKQSGEPISWKASQIQRLFTALQTAPIQPRAALIDDLRSSAEIRQHLIAALRGLKDAATLEPCIPENHVKVALLSPLAKMPVDNILPTIAKLSNNSHHLLYHCGLIAYMTGQSEIAIESWHRCLDVRLDHIEPIYRMSSQRFSPSIVAGSIIPSRRMDLAVRLITSVPATDSVRRDEIASAIVAAIAKREDIDAAIRWSWTAKIFESVQQHQQASDAWQKAVATGGRNLEYRYSLAVSLNRIGQTEKAIDQALLGSAIASGDDRFDRLIKHFRRELTRKSEQRRPVSRSAARLLGGNQINSKVSL